MMTKANGLTSIRYAKKSTGEVSERVIIPTYVPQPNMKALDVTELSENDRERLQELYSEYQEYYTTAAKQLFAFEDWISHTQGEDVQFDIKWRTFVTENTEILE